MPQGAEAQGCRPEGYIAYDSEFGPPYTGSPTRSYGSLITGIITLLIIGGTPISPFRGVISRVISPVLIGC